VECLTALDCDDGDTCTTDSCQAGACVHDGDDADSDDVLDCTDNCAAVANPGQADFDGDGRGNACETGAAAADADRSGRVDGLDLARLARAFSTGCGEPGYDPAVDLDLDCSIDGSDLAHLAIHWAEEVVP
jgi:hypothetical protein